jgi:hypothetical protein
MNEYRVIAHNSATESTNKIHDDQVAKQYGFRGGLVPGVTLFAYLLHPVLERHGRDFLDGGTMSARFVSPIYEGEEVVVALDGEAVTLTNPAGEVCCTGAVGHDPTGPLDVVTDAGGVLPSPKLAPEPASLPHGRVLGGLSSTASVEAAHRHLDSIGELPPAGVLRDDEIHPGVVLRLANDVLVANVAMGPWIHTASEMTVHAPVLDGQPLVTTATVVDGFTRKGNDWVVLDVVLVAGGAPVMRVRHTAIYRLGAPGSAA